MQPLTGEDPPQDQVTNFKCSRADAAAVLPPQRLLITCRPEGSSAAALLAEHEVHPLGGILAFLIEIQDPCGAMLDLVREDRF